MFVKKGANGIDVNMFKLFLILYSDYTVLFANSIQGLQTNLDLLYEYCKKWKLLVNVDKTKIMIFRKSGRRSDNMEINNKKWLIDVCT